MHNVKIEYLDGSKIELNVKRLNYNIGRVGNVNKVVLEFVNGDGIYYDNIEEIINKDSEINTIFINNKIILARNEEKYLPFVPSIFVSNVGAITGSSDDDDKINFLNFIVEYSKKPLEE